MLFLRERGRLGPFPENPEQEARRLGQQEKKRVVGLAKKLGLSPFENLVLRQRTIESTQGGAPLVVDEVLLNEWGISRSSVDRIIAINGKELTIHRTIEIPIEDYPRFGKLVDSAIPSPK
jgi:hypothetical protein